MAEGSGLKLQARPPCGLKVISGLVLSASRKHSRTVEGSKEFGSVSKARQQLETNPKSGNAAWPDATALASFCTCRGMVLDQLKAPFGSDTC